MPKSPLKKLTAETKARFPKELARRYWPDGILGTGAIGSVYLARDRGLDRHVAIKLLHNPGHDEIEQRFLREAEILGRIDHPGIVRVYDFGLSSGGPYMILEHLQGISLDQPSPRLDLTALARQVARGLAAVHEAGVVHRDLKPANLMRLESGRIVLIDFGMVRDPKMTTLTRTGVLVGTPAYMAPEVLRGGKIAPAADWYALGIALYTLAEGDKPFGMEAIHHFLRHDQFPELLFRNLNPDDRIRRLIEALTEINPEKRPSRLDAVLRILDGHWDRPVVSKSQFENEQATQFPALEASPFTPSWTVRAASASVLCGSLMLGSYLATPPPAPVPSQGLAVAAIILPSVFPAEFSEQLQSELAAAQFVVLDAKGRRLKSSEGRAVNGSQELLTPDPLLWDRQLEAVPTINRFSRWQHAGGMAEKLPDEDRARLRKVGRMFQNQDLPDPFFPFLEAPPTAVSGPVPEVFFRSVSGYDWDRWAPSLRARPGPWFRAAAKHYLEATADRDQRREDTDASLEQHRSIGGYPEQLTRIPLHVRGRSLNDLVEGFGSVTGSRMLLGPWLEPGHLLLRRFVYTAGRCLAEEPETRDFAAVVLSGAAEKLDALWFGSHGFADPVGMLGAPHASPASRAFLGTLRARTGFLRWHIDGHDGPARTRAAEDFAAAMVPGPGPAVVLRQGWALRRFLRVLRELNRSREVIPTLRKFRPLIPKLRRSDALAAIDEVLKAWQEQEIPVEREMLGWIQRWFDADTGENNKVKARLRRYQKELDNPLAASKR